MNQNIEEKISESIKVEDKRAIYLVIKGALEVYEDLVRDNGAVFSGQFFGELKGRLLSYVVKRAFDTSLLSSEFPFDINVARMGYSQLRPELRKDNVILTLSKVQDSNKLPAKAKYKKIYARGNSLYSHQQMFNLNTGNIEDSPLYGIISYEMDGVNLKELNIIFPNGEYNSILSRVRIPTIDIVSHEDTTEDERSIINTEDLREEILRDVLNKSV